MIDDVGLTADIEEVHVAGHAESEDGLIVTRCRCHGDVLEKYSPESQNASRLDQGQPACFGGTAFMAVAAARPYYGGTSFPRVAGNV